MSAQAATKGTEDLKSTLVLDLCQGILETPCFDAACPPSYEQLRVAFEELHEALDKELCLIFAGDELKREQHTGEGEPRA